MTRPEWDGISQRYVTWDGVILPCKSVGGREDGDQGAWCASIPMENRCTLDLHVPGEDEDKPCWVSIAPDVWDRPGSENLGELRASIEDGKIVVRHIPFDPDATMEERVFRAVMSPVWMCDVEGPEEVLDFASRWGRLGVIRR